MSLARDVTTVGSATLASRLLGFLRDVGVAAVLGAGAPADAYFAALQIANLVRRLLAEGAVKSAFVPMWLRIRASEGVDGARRFGAEALGGTLTLLGALVVLGILLAPAVIALLAPGFAAGEERAVLAVSFLRLSLPYVVLAGAVAIAAAALNGERRVGAASAGIVVFNGVLLAALAVVILLGDDAASAGAILAGSFVLAGCAQLALVGAAWMRLPVRPRRARLFPSAPTRVFFAAVIPGLVAAGIPQLKMIAGAMIASSSPAAVSWLYYANRLYELPLGVVSVAVAAVRTPAIAASLRAEAAGSGAAAQSRAFEIALGLALPAAVALAVLALPIATALFERGAFGPRDSAMVAAALAAISAGLPGQVLEKVLGAVSFAHEDMRSPVAAALTGLAVAIGAALLAFPRHGPVGVAAAIALSGWVGAAILAVLLRRRGWLALDPQARHRLPRIVVATLVMGAALALGGTVVPAGHVASGGARLAALAALVGGGLAGSGAGLQATGVARLRDLVAAMRRPLAP